MDPVEFRPYGKRGISLIVLGVMNIFLGFPKVGGEQLGPLIGGAFDVVFMGAMSFLGYWLYRQKVVVKENSVQFIRTAQGIQDLSIKREDMLSAEYNHLKQMVEIKTTSGVHLISIPEKSEALAKIKSLLLTTRNAQAGDEKRNET